MTGMTMELEVLSAANIDAIDFGQWEKKVRETIASHELKDTDAIKLLTRLVHPDLQDAMSRK